MSFIKRCIKCNCNAEMTSHYKDWFDNHCCADHLYNKEVFYCSSCGKLHLRDNGRSYPNGFFFCNDCIGRS